MQVHDQSSPRRIMTCIVCHHWAHAPSPSSGCRIAAETLPQVCLWCGLVRRFSLELEGDLAPVQHLSTAYLSSILVWLSSEAGTALLLLMLISLICRDLQGWHHGVWGGTALRTVAACYAPALCSTVFNVMTSIIL